MGSLPFDYGFKTAAIYLQKKSYSTWRGYRLSGADGAKVQLPSDENLPAIFGTVKTVQRIPHKFKFFSMF
jgi:hypothetical protein